MQVTPIDYYHQQCELGIISEDPIQLATIKHLQLVYHNLLVEHQRRTSFMAWIWKPHLVKGVYLWGSVGIGKTFLMDCFFYCLPFSAKLRMHFHQFMQMVHNKLTQHQGEQDPLLAIAKELAQQAMVLCFDEFFVSDITDAMLLGRLLKALATNGVCLVATSNVPPDDLYKNGLQRSQFLPAIAMLKENATVIHAPITIDYRLQHLKKAGVFYSPLNDETRTNMERNFTTLTIGIPVINTPIWVHDRPINVQKRTTDIVWFEFADICNVPRSQADYLAIAENYHTVFISNIPVIPVSAKDTICLFISLVDVFYDARVHLVISAARPVAQLYSHGFMTLEYARTHSRLLEMQSEDYFINKYHAK